MDVTLPPELAGFVEEKVRSGAFASASEVVREALELMRSNQGRLKELRKEIAIGVEQADRGELIDRDVVFEELRLRSAERRAL